jgi:hypothetical protein
MDLAKPDKVVSLVPETEVSDYIVVGWGLAGFADE